MSETSRTTLLTNLMQEARARAATDYDHVMGDFTLTSDNRTWVAACMSCREETRVVLAPREGEQQTSGIPRGVSCWEIGRTGFMQVGLDA